MSSQWQDIDWQGLSDLRERFLGGVVSDRPYWSSERLLASYDLTFAARIGWKWDAVLQSARLTGWTPDADVWLDWGCGTGVAARTLLRNFPENAPDVIELWDHSNDAVRFAAARIKEEFPKVTVELLSSVPRSIKEEQRGAEGTAQRRLVIVSHVLNELSASAEAQLVEFLWSARSVLWVEPGAFGESRRLVALRERLRKKFCLWSPCPHQDACPLFQSSGQDWCHHFAHPPVEAFTDSNWARFSQLMGIDMRSLPYSHLVMDERARSLQTTAGRAVTARILGQPREYHGYMKVLSCECGGVQERVLQKRDDKQLYKLLRKERISTLHNWRLLDGKIVGDVTE